MKFRLCKLTAALSLSFIAMGRPARRNSVPCISASQKPGRFRTGAMASRERDGIMMFESKAVGGRRHPLRLAGAIALTLATLSPAHATLQTYSLEGVLDSGHYAGSKFSGSFSFDDVVLTGSGEEWLAVETLSLGLLDAVYTLDDAEALAEVAYRDGSFLGLSYSVSSSEPMFSFIPGSLDASDAFIAYETELGAFGAGSVTYTSGPIPEPKDWLMMLAGLGFVGLMVGRTKYRVP